MADIFISYKREDKHLAEDTIHQLQAAGFSVWYDERITPHTSWDETIEAEIAAARAVVVLWTPRSVLSEWVRTEADYAKEKGKLVPVMLEACSVPLAYRRTQTVDLSGWDGNPADRSFQKLVEWVRGLVTGTGSAPRSIGPSSFGSEPARKKRKGGLVPVLSVLGIALIGGAGALYATGMIPLPALAPATTPAQPDPGVAVPVEAVDPDPAPTPEPAGPTPEEIDAQAEADRIARERAAQEERDRIERERLAAIPSCFKITLTADDRGNNNLAWDFPAPRPDPQVTSASHSSLRFGCDDTYRCSSGNIQNPSRLEQVTLLVMDDDIDEDDLMGAGNCRIPSTGCRVGRVSVDVYPC